MKIRSLIIFLISLLILNIEVKAETIFFDSKNIKVEQNGDMIYATKGIAKIPSKNLEIKGDKFIYDKKISELIIFDDVEYFDDIKKIYIESDKLIYNELKNTIFSQSKTFIKLENIYDVNSSDVFYDRNLMKISSRELTEVNDNDEK